MVVLDYIPVGVFGMPFCIVVLPEEYIYKCFCGQPARVYHKNTLYCEELDFMNYGVCCEEHEEEEYEYYAELWKEYYAGCMG